MTVDWKKLAKPQPEIIGDIRSCRNCAHRVGPSYMWQCARTGTLIGLALRPGGACGPEAKLWGPRPPWWRRWFLGA